MTSPDTRTRALERDMDPEAAGSLLRERIRSLGSQGRRGALLGAPLVTSEWRYMGCGRWVSFGAPGHEEYTAGCDFCSRWRVS